MSAGNYTVQYDFDASPTDSSRYVAVVHMYRPVPRLSEQIDRPGNVVEFDWMPHGVEALSIKGATRYELEREAQKIAHEQMSMPYDKEDVDNAGALAWWASRPGPDASESTFREWREAMPVIVWKVDVVCVSPYVLKREATS